MTFAVGVIHSICKNSRNKRLLLIEEIFPEIHFKPISNSMGKIIIFNKTNMAKEHKESLDVANSSVFFDLLLNFFFLSCQPQNAFPKLPFKIMHNIPTAGSPKTLRLFLITVTDFVPQKGSVGCGISPIIMPKKKAIITGFCIVRSIACDN